jgi:cell division protein FtsB
MGFKLSLILGGLLIASVSGSAFYIKYLHNQMAVLQGNQIVLETKIEEQNASIENYLSKQKKHQAQLDNLETKRKEAERAVTELRNKFARHDLNNLALMKPKLIENRVNKASAKVMQNLVNLTNPTESNNNEDTN